VDAWIDRQTDAQTDSCPGRYANRWMIEWMEARLQTHLKTSEKKHLSNPTNLHFISATVATNPLYICWELFGFLLRGGGAKFILIFMQIEMQSL